MPLLNNRQMLMFSATLDNAVSKIASEFLTNPLTISIKPDTKGHSNIQQSLYYVDNQLHKQNLLKHFLADVNLNQAIIFTATKRLINAAKEMDFTFHRAFDCTENAIESLEQLIDLKIKRVLSSGQKQTAYNGLRRSRLKPRI